MVNLQSEFIEFHNNIKLDDENDTLRDKRDTLLSLLSKNLPDETPAYSHFNQGSYAMHTGIKPENGDYDIDVGLKFEIAAEDYDDPVEAKKWVRDALVDHVKNVDIRRSCVTVTYQKNKEDQFHVDFAVYANKNSDGKMYISKGKENSLPENKKWEVSDPEDLITKIRDRFDGDDAKQFRRVIRYLKKWKNHVFSAEGNSAPTGIALTILAYHFFNASKEYDFVAKTTKYNDFKALKALASAIKGKFVYKYNADDDCYYHSIETNLPVEPYNDLFEKMTAKQKESFYNKICSMIDRLDSAESRTKKSEACSDLVKLFGSDFPVKTDKSIVGTSESA